MRDRVAVVLAAVTLAIHLAVANRYDLFRDELYFIVCGRHPQFGYADQPPLVPLLAAATDALGAHTWIVRIPGALAAAALVWLAVAFTRLLGGRTGAAIFAGLAAAFAPLLMGVTATLNTTTFEPLAWMAVAYAIARAVVLDDRRALIVAGVVAGVAMEAKYSLPLWLIALGAGLLVTPQRVILARRELWIGLAAAVVIALPSLIWQNAQHWPFAELVHHAGDKNAHVAATAYVLNQVLVMNPFAAPLWIGALIGVFALPALAPMRFVAIAFVITAAATIAGGGKDYYLAPAYAPLFAIGAVALERWSSRPALRVVHAALLVLVGAMFAPLALPILDPPVLIAYEQALHVVPQAQEKIDQGSVLPPTFGDMFGWHEFARSVGAAYASLTPAERVDTSILVDNYGEAAALDVYGAAYGLPPALSGHNQYGLWALRGEAAHNLLRVQRHPERLRPYCTSMRVIGTTQAQYARSFENGLTIAYCAGLHPSLASMWPEETFLE